MMWRYSHRAETRSRLIADRHYNRQKIGTPQFVPPGRCAVFYAGTETGEAFWVTSWPFAEYVKHAWGGSWICSAFRNEGAGCASVLIRQALSATRAVMGEPPELNRARTLAEGQRAMGIDWMPWAALTQAIPPAYSEFIGRAALNYIRGGKDAEGSRLSAAAPK